MLISNAEEDLVDWGEIISNKKTSTEVKGLIQRKILKVRSLKGKDI